MEEGELILEEENYFFDTYAIVEILDGNADYKKYVSKSVTITIYNLAEIYWHAINEYNQEQADEIYKKYKDAVIDIDDETLKEAIKFRKEHKKKDLSYADCIGYIYAKRHNMKFLTGDKGFEGIGNVEFVK